MKGYFDEAINNNEITAYFKGEGDYFAPNEWSRGYHNYMINFMGMMGGLKKLEHPYQELVKYFRNKKSGLSDPYGHRSMFNKDSDLISPKWRPFNK